MYPSLPPLFLHSSNIYCVNLRQYSVEGSFRAFQHQLPRLQHMGVKILWFMPIYPIGKVKRKGTLGSYYSISNFTSTNPEFGTAEEFKKLVEAAHAAGMKVILDWVANHAAWDNVWTIDHPEYFERDEHGNFKPPYDWDDVIQIDHSNEAQQTAMTEAMLYWIREFDIDGFRADLAHLTPLSFWIQARQRASALKIDLVWLAETENIEYHQAFDISFTWRWMHDTEAYCKGQKKFSDLLATLYDYQAQFPTNALRLWFTSNHDENSWNGTAFEKYGNYVKALTVFNVMYPGIPLVYSGEESGLSKRLQFFDKDVIDWQLPSPWEQLYSKLFFIRSNNPVFKQGISAEFKWLNSAAEKNMLAFQRKFLNDAVSVIINMGAEAQDWYLGLDETTNRDPVFGENYYLAEASTAIIQPGGFMVIQSCIS